MAPRATVGSSLRRWVSLIFRPVGAFQGESDDCDEFTLEDLLCGGGQEAVVPLENRITDYLDELSEPDDDDLAGAQDVLER